ncbi:class I SAM-dependent methyltransferase [Candidatus Raskinella chloraquaticus]|uniref:Methyltransferase type 11 domain-containing protein n=1 Tax=Candidatus Raskinella chloraquaticus TaxID=1951219 RepID=A0A1W9I516_9HYPH|nr:MAG: hypothetical protein A4S15_03590 [Proteobacteria bacterium SG_bin8]
MDWKSFWDQPNAIYVSERHRIVHYRLIADELIALAGETAPALLDHGCGEALEAERVASACGRLYLVDAAPSVRAKLSARLGSFPGVAVLSPEDATAIADSSLDLVVANSVLQYLSSDELDASLALWRTKLKAGGRLVLADIVQPDVSPLADIGALLSLAWRHGFFPAALLGLMRTALSPYARLRKNLGLSMHREAELLARLSRFGFAATRATRNLGHNQARMTLIAQPA